MADKHGLLVSINEDHSLLDQSDRRRIYTLSIAFFVMASGFNAAQNYITTLLGSDGNYSLGALYFFLGLSALAAPCSLQRIKGKNNQLQLKGEKNALILGCLGYAPYLASLALGNMLPLQMATAALLGLASGILWITQGSVMTSCSRPNNRDRMAGIFWGVYQAGCIVGNFLGFIVHDFIPSTAMLFLMCTTLVCVATNIHFFAFRPRSEAEVLSLMPAPATTARPYRPFLATPVARSQESNSNSSKKDESAPPEPSAVSNTPKQNSSMESVTLNPSSLSEAHSLEDKPAKSQVLASIGLCGSARAVLGLFAVPQSLLMMPMCLFIGAETAYWSGTFPTFLDESRIGLVLAFLAIGEVVASFAVGPLVERSGQAAVLLLGFIFMGAGLTLSVWGVQQRRVDWMVFDAPLIDFITALCLGIADAVLNTLTAARLGNLADDWRLFPSSSAFAFYQLCNSAATAAAMGYSPSLPMDESLTQVWILCALGIAAFFGFLLSRPRGSPPPAPRVRGSMFTSMGKERPETAWVDVD